MGIFRLIKLEKTDFFSEGIVNPDCYYELSQSFLWELLKTKKNKKKKSGLSIFDVGCYTVALKAS